MGCVPGCVRRRAAVFPRAVPDIDCMMPGSPFASEMIKQWLVQEFMLCFSGQLHVELLHSHLLRCFCMLLFLNACNSQCRFSLLCYFRAPFVMLATRSTRDSMQLNWSMLSPLSLMLFGTLQRSLFRRGQIEFAVGETPKSK